MGEEFIEPQDKLWVDFIIRLKETGMPLRDIQEYARLREKGRETVDIRQCLLEKHHQFLQENIKKQLEHLEMLENKIHLYKIGKVC